MAARKILVIEFDVTGFTPEQVESLEREATIQAEASEGTYFTPDDQLIENAGHPDAEVVSARTVEIDDKLLELVREGNGSATVVRS